MAVAAVYRTAYTAHWPCTMLPPYVSVDGLSVVNLMVALVLSRVQMRLYVLPMPKSMMRSNADRVP